MNEVPIPDDAQAQLGVIIQEHQNAVAQANARAQQVTQIFISGLLIGMSLKGNWTVDTDRMVLIQAEEPKAVEHSEGD